MARVEGVRNRTCAMPRAGRASSTRCDARSEWTMLQGAAAGTDVDAAVHGIELDLRTAASQLA